MTKKLNIFLAGPRGFCAGVDRAIEMVKGALKKYGAPVYVRHEIVNITKLTVGKITDIELSDNELNKVIETHKGSFN